MNDANRPTVELLRQVLDRAERGELTGVAIATTSPDLCTASAWAMEAATIAELLGSVDMLYFRLLHQMRDGEESNP
jgi:hypothetical protein